MVDALVPSGAVAGNAEMLPRFVCALTYGGPDIATVPQLEQTLREPRSQVPLLVLDLSELLFIDSSGVHAIVNASLRARQAGRRLVLLRCPANLERLFRLAGNHDDVEISDVDPAESPVGAVPRPHERKPAS
jgi:anti-anti-sigma factor